MSIYVIIGANSVNIDITEKEYPFINKIYMITTENFEFSDEKIEVINDMNALDFYASKDFENLDDSVVFIDCIGDKEIYLDVMYMLNTTRFNNRSYYVSKSKTLNFKNFPLVNHFNPWTGEELPLTLTNLERDKIMEMFANMTKIIKSYLNSGFQNKQILSIPDGWMLNFATPELHHLITYYELIPDAQDLKGNLKNVEYLHNSQYRQIVTKTLIHVTVNYLVRNGYIQNYTNVDWFNPDTWQNF